MIFHIIQCDNYSGKKDDESLTRRKRRRKGKKKLICQIEETVSEQLPPNHVKPTRRSGFGLGAGQRKF